MTVAKLVITVDYEGMTLQDNNLKAFRRFQDNNKDVPLTHLLNPTYLLTTSSREGVIDTLRSLIKPGDELGMHVHGHKVLVESAGVKFNEDFISYFNRDLKYWTHVTEDTRLHGFECLIEESYTQEEISNIISFSRRTLEEAGFAIGMTFRSGGWFTGMKVANAIRENGFRVDCSAQPAGWLLNMIIDKRRIKHDVIRMTIVDLYHCVAEYWPKTTPLTPPWYVFKPPNSLIEMPDTGSAADYVTANLMLRHIKKILSNDTPYVYPHLSFHQENCAKFLPRIQKVIEAVRGDNNVEFCTSSVAAETFKVSVQT